jgi:hypothetical protein
MPDEARPDCRLVVIVTHPDRDALLTVPAPDGAAGWTLPSTIISSEAPVHDWIAAFDGLLGVPTVMLRHDTLSSADHDHPTLVVAEIEPIMPSTIGARWAEVEGLVVEDAEKAVRTAVARWLARRAGHGASPRADWSRPGWFARASAWMLESLVAAGRQPVGTPVQHYLWSLTSVLRARTTTGDVYLKATSALFPQEVPVTALLATRTPGLTPAVISTNPAEAWLLMVDNGGRPLGEEPEASWVAGIETHARIQRAWAGDVATVRAAGAPHRPLAKLAVAAAAIGQDAATMARLDNGLAAAYRAAVPRLVEACARLEAIGLDESIVHGDLHPWNVAVRDGGCVVFDWSDAAVGHPFIDLVPYVFRARDVAVRRAMVDAYLAQWSDVSSREQLQQAAALALPLGCLYQVVSYRAIFAGLDPDDLDDMHDADIDWLDRTLRALDQGIEAHRPD